MELVTLFTRYPATTVIFIAWPLLFVWLLVWVMKENGKREERAVLREEKLFTCHEKLQEKVAELAEKIVKKSKSSKS